MGVGQGGRYLYSAACDMKNYFLIGSPELQSGSPQKAGHSDIMTTAHHHQTQLAPPVSRHIFIGISYALCQGGFCKLILVLVTGNLVASLNLGDEEGHRSVDPRAQTVTRVLGYVSTHAWGLHTEDARIFFKFKRSLCIPVFLEI